MSEFLTVSTGQQFNVSEDAAKILRSATEGVQRILARREALDREGKQNQTLFIAAGELHGNVPDGVHHMIILKKLRERFTDVVLGFEYSHVQPRHLMLLEVLEKFPQSRILQAVSEVAFDETTSLNAAIGFEDKGYLRRRVWQFSQKEKIPTVFTDAAMNNYEFDESDVTTCESIKACVGYLGRHFGEVRVTDPVGIKTRNHHMVERAAEYIEHNNPRIFYQQCGTSHVMGDPELGDLYKNSLIAFAKKKRLPVMALSKDTNVSWLDHKLGKEKFYPIVDLPRALIPFLDDEGDLSTIQDQIDYTNAILELVGLENHVMSIHKYEADIFGAKSRSLEFVMKLLDFPSPR